MNKSLATNLIALLIIIAGYFSPYYRDNILSIGFFAISGSITNWLAIFMLFEKIPLLYGSGVIPARFEDFKSGIKNLVMTQFFNYDNITHFFEDTSDTPADVINIDSVLAVIDYDKIFNNLLESVKESPIGGILSMFGGAKALEPLREPFNKKVEHSIREIAESEEFTNAIKENFKVTNITDEVIDKVDSIVDKRLSELTPQMVKEIIQEMIRAHLGWLVVWGGVFGGLIGAVMSVINI